MSKDDKKSKSSEPEVKSGGKGVSIGEWLSKTPSVRKGIGARYLEVGFRNYARKNLPYLQPEANWLSEWNKFVKEVK